MGYPIVHFEILGKDREALCAFYAGVFDWQIQQIPEMHYALVDTGAGEQAVRGGIGSPPDGTSMVTVYVGVPDISAHLSKIEAAGGQTVMPRTELGMVTLALFTDPEGHVIGLVEGAQEPGAGEQA
jgi:predicted enzyme related to lactoylglutathione lyase